MSEDSPRSTPGNAPQRRPTEAPSWWAELQRSDLPEDQRSAKPRGRTQGGRAHARERSGVRPLAEFDAMFPVQADRGWGAWRVMTTVLFVVAATFALAWFGIAGGNMSSIVVVLLIFGVPAGLAAAVVALVARKTS
jgi:hypothetical protein